MRKIFFGAAIALCGLTSLTASAVAARTITREALTQLVAECVNWVHLQGIQHPSQSNDFNSFNAYFDRTHAVISTHGSDQDSYYFEKCMALHNFSIGQWKDRQ